MHEIDKKLTIVMAVYNKKNIIKRAIDSILCQDTNYSYKILIVDDCSSDESQIIIQEYMKQYPDIIEFHQNEKNMRYLGTVLTACELITTPYWTVLDPDDYWIDKNHLNDAVKFLENNQDYALYATNTMMLSDTGENLGVTSSNLSNSDYDIKTSKLCPYTHTSATFFRNYYTPSNISELKKYINTPYEKAIEGDTFRNFWHLNKGKGFYYNEINSVYEIDKKGIYSSLDEIQKNVLNAKIFYFCYLYFDKNIEYDFIGFVRLYLNKIYSSISFLDIGDIEKNEIIDLSNVVKILENKNLFQEGKAVTKVVDINDTIKKQSKKYYLFKFILILSVKYRNNVCRVNIFGFLPILKIRYK